MPKPEVKVKINGDGKGFDNALNRASGAASAFAGRIAGMLGAAFSVAGIAAFTKAQIDFASSINNAAAKASIGTDMFQQLSYAAKLTGTSTESVSSAFNNLSKNIADALGGDTKKLKVFEQLGVDKALLQTGNLEQIFMRIANTASKSDFGATSVALFSQVLGKAATEIIPMMGNNLAEVMQIAKETGAVIGSETLTELGKVGDEIDSITMQLKGPMAEAALFILKTIKSVVDSLREMKDFMTGAFAEWDKRRKNGQVSFSAESFKPIVEAGIKNSVDESMKRDEQNLELIRAKKKAENDRKKIIPDWEGLSGIAKSEKIQPLTDSLAKIGGGVGRMEPTMAETKMLSELKKIREGMDSVARVAAKTR